jgi:hypothetical protein
MAPSQFSNITTINSYYPEYTTDATGQQLTASLAFVPFADFVLSLRPISKRSLRNKAMPLAKSWQHHHRSQLSLPLISNMIRTLLPPLGCPEGFRFSS